MSACCNEPECRRKKPFHIRRGWLTGQVFLITDYTVDPHSDGERLRMKSRHDITEEIERSMRSEGWEPPKPMPKPKIPSRNLRLTPNNFNPRDVAILGGDPSL